VLVPKEKEDSLVRDKNFQIVLPQSHLPANCFCLLGHVGYRYDVSGDNGSGDNGFLDLFDEAVLEIYCRELLLGHFVEIFCSYDELVMESLDELRHVFFHFASNFGQYAIH